MAFQFDIIASNFPALLSGAGMTLGVSLVSIGLGIPLGLAVCFGVLSRNPVLSLMARFFVSLLRGMPILVLLLIVFYLLPEVGIEAPPLVAAVAGLSLNTAAFQAEIFRAGFAAIPHGQVEAAQVLGMTPWQTRRRILIPQMFRLVVPPLTNEVIVLLKNSSLVSVIAVTELMRTGQHIVSKTYRPTEIYVAAALFYLVMNLGLAWAGKAIRNRIGEG